MFRIFSKVLLAFLICSFFIVYNAEAKVKLSKKYTPPGNPGGKDFYEDEDFAESYKLYEKRRKLLKKKKLQNKTNVNIRKEDLVQKLREKRIVNEPGYAKACTVEDEKDPENAMINQHGINIARLKGARFIDDDFNSEPVYQYESNEKGFTSAQEKKISPVSITIKEDLPKKTTCSHDFLDNMSKNPDINLQNGYMHDTDSFGSVVDTTE